MIALALTAAVRWWAVQHVGQHPEARQNAVVESALTTVEQRFEALHERVRNRAQRLATDSVVIEGLRTWNEHNTRPPSLAQRVLDVSLDDRTTIEVYDPSPRALAWHGPHMPLGGAPGTEAFLRRPQTEIVGKGAVRRALAVWWPVRAPGGAALGAVRVTYVTRYQPPVRNRHVQGYSLQEEWEQETGESLRLAWTAPPSVLDRPHRTLQGTYDTLGYVTVTPPSPEQLIRRTASFYDDLLAGGAVLLLAWLVCMVGGWYLRLARRPGTRRLARARIAAAGRFGCLALLWVGVRYALLVFDVPARWIGEVEALSVLFDPTRLASAIGGGIFRSIGDLFLTGVWAALLAAGGLHLALRFRPRAETVEELIESLQDESPRHPSSVRFLGVVATLVVLCLASTLGLAYVVRRAVLDSTLDFFSRTGLLPEPLVLVVLSALVLLVVAVVVFGVASTWVGIRFGLRYQPDWPGGLVPMNVFVLFVLGLAGLYLGTDAQVLVPFPYPVAMMGGVGAAAVYGMVGRKGGTEVFTIRGMLLSLLTVTLLFYPLLYAGMDAQRRERMVEAAHSFEEGYDPRALYSIRQVLRAVDDDLAPVLRKEGAPIDSVATRLVGRSLLASLTTYEVSLTLFDDDGTLRRRYGPEGRQPIRAGPRRIDNAVFTVLRRLHERQLSPGPVIDRLAGDRGVVRPGERFQYAGLLRVDSTDTAEGGWVLLRAEPRSILPGTGPGVPRVLLPDGSFSDLYAEMSLAEFRSGTLVRSYGESFGRTQLPTASLAALREQPAVWRTETIQGRRYLTYYYRPAEDDRVTVAARIPSILAFDHLYYLLRLTVAGLGVALFIYLAGLYGRYRYGLVPARRVRFRNKVLNAFLLVGIVSMVAVGVVGVQVVTGENRRVVERRLRDHLARVEETLSLEARPDEPLWQAAARADVDSLAARVGLDLRIYEDGQLVGTSRPRLVREGLVDERLPGRVYYELYDEAYRFTTAQAAIGQFRYRVGYQALVDEEGDPRFVIGIPTLAQQEQVAEEQARTLAYLFGALLVLVVVVMLTAVILANALAQPIARLREGLEAVGEGRFAEALPVDTRDEIGDLVRTFNEMRAQLAESRRKLAQQEREIAWREMARQVAHEIKNPLTPMKLSIQHLRRAFEREHEDDDSRFARLFDRITTTLIEQIESLVRIANEFSTFARLPTRVPEPLDLNEVIEEAVRLMEEDADAGCIELDLHPEALVVEADREELRRTFINLLKNALQALPDDREGRIRVTTTRRTDGDAPVAESRVVDNGTGIPPEAQDKIFEPNFSTKTSGTGLGLAIAQKSIDELGGTIDYETEEGEGTTFWVRLPLADEEGS